jgi:inorganic pyrophosphatase
LGVFRISRVLPAGMAFPYDFGSIPCTRAEDGDPLDVLVLTAAPTFAGCLITTRLIGVLRAQQTEHGRRIRNDRLIGVVETPVNPASMHELKQLGAPQIGEIEQFFISYNRAQGRDFRVTGRLGSRAAQVALNRAAKAFKSAAAD